MVTDDNSARQNSNKKMVLVAVMVAVVVAIVLLLMWVFSPEPPAKPEVSRPDVSQEEPPEAAPEPAPEIEEPQAPEQPAAPAEPEVQQPQEEPLPELANSDKAIREDVNDLSSSDALAEVITRDDIIRKSVRAVSALEEGALVHKYRPLAGPEEAFTAEPVEQSGEGDEPRKYRMTEQSYQRYDKYINMLVRIEPSDLAALYNRYYPLLEQAFAEQGVDKGSFREVTLAAIDQLLAAPEIEGEILLVRPSVAYKFADPDLESLPAAHKLMLRMGPENSRKLKNVLRHLRAELEQ